MGDRFAVRGFERSGELNGGAQCLGDGHRPFDLLPFDVLHHEVVGTDVEDLAYVGVVQSRDGAGFAFEAFAEDFAGGFDGDYAVETGVAGLPDFSHATGADGREDLVGA